MVTKALPSGCVSTILPNGLCTVLPARPTNGQVFVDSDGVRWVYSTGLDLWERVGVAHSLPLATATSSGLMAPQDKTALDSVPAVGGGFGLIVDPKLIANPNNPDGTIQGDIVLKSDSLDIVCVGPSMNKLDCVPTSAGFCEIAAPQDPRCPTTPDQGSIGAPGLLFRPSERFLSTLIVNHPGPKGKVGCRGPKGPQGINGYGDGPRGVDGPKGDDSTDICTLTGVTFQDIDGLTDTPVVDLAITDCKLIVTNGKINVPQSQPADQVSALPLTRTVTYQPDPDPAFPDCKLSRLDNWKLAQPSGDTTPLDLQLLRLARGTNPGDPAMFNNMSLSTFVGDIVGEYKSRLATIDDQWFTQAKQYVQDLDDKARGILSELASELAQCQFNLPAVEYCVTLDGCNQPPPPPPPPPPPSPQAAAALMAGEDVPIRTSKRVGGLAMGVRRWEIRS